MRDQHLRSLASVPIGKEDVSLSVLKSELPLETLSQGSRRDLNVLIWNLTLIACRGRIPLGTDPMAPVTLHHWPNLTRLQLFPHAFRIAALWMRKPSSLRDTAETLNIPQRYVFAFYSATKALGLAGTIASAPVKQRPARKRVKSSLLNRILSHMQFRRETSLEHI